MSKVRNLPSTTSLADNDLLYTVDTSVSVNGGRKITKQNLKTSVAPTAAETKAAYESNADTNAFTDAEKTKLATVQANAAFQTAAEVPYSNTGSGLSATDVQDAIDEVNTNSQADFRPSIVSGRILQYSGGTARFDGTFYSILTNNILLDQSVTLGHVYVDLDGVVKQTSSTPPPYTIVFAQFSTDLNDITFLSDQRVKNSQNIVRGILADVRDVRAGAAASEGSSGRVSDAMHKHNILTATPEALAPNQANAEGVSISLARADHIHNIPTSSAVGLDTTSTSTDGSGVAFSKNDHTHAIASGVPSTQTPDQANDAGTSPNFAKADHIHNIPAAAPTTNLSPATTNTEGVGTSFARNDHTHAVDTGLNADISTILPNDTAAAGVIDKFSRADHKHAIATAAAVTQTPDQANAEGASTSFARADHVHNIPATAPTTTLSPATTNDEGVAASFARGDHSHAVATALVGSITTIQPDATADAGVANNFARGDHRHAIVADVPVSTGVANAEGASTSFARADHVHNTIVSATEVKSSTLFTSASLTDVVITGFTTTPAAGTYLVLMNIDVDFDTNNRTNTVSIYAGGVQVTNTERSNNNFDQNQIGQASTQGLVTVNGSQAVDGRVRMDGGTISITNRSLILVRML